jgi:hypothetical protein
MDSKTKVFEDKFGIKPDAQFEYQDKCGNEFVHLSWPGNYFFLTLSSLASEERKHPKSGTGLDTNVYTFSRGPMCASWVRHEIRRVFPFRKNKSIAWDIVLPNMTRPRDQPYERAERHLGCSYRHRSVIRSVALLRRTVPHTCRFVFAILGGSRSTTLGEAPAIGGRIYPKDECNLRQTVAMGSSDSSRVFQERNDLTCRDNLKRFSAMVNYCTVDCVLQARHYVVVDYAFEK